MLPSGYGALEILIVDDIANTRQILRAILRHLGFARVTEASSTTEALEIIKEIGPDLVFTDWDMPGASGLDLIRIIRSHPESPDPTLPIILLTAHGDRQYVKAGRDAGATDFLVKPLAPARIRDRILDVVSRPRGFVSAPGYKGPDRRRLDRPVAQDRRSLDAPASDVVLLPPDGLLMAKVSGDEMAVKRALQSRVSILRALASPPQERSTAGMIAAANAVAVREDLDRLVSEALSALDRCADTLSRMSEPLERFRRGAMDRMPSSAGRVIGSLQRLIADPARVAADPGIIRLHLLAIRAMLRVGADPGAERTATELANQIEALIQRRSD
jgi:CheY-like chemotaxis protein